MAISVVYATGWKVTEEQMEEAASMSGVLETSCDYLPPDFRRRCEEIIKDPLQVKASDCADAFAYLKHRFNSQ